MDADLDSQPLYYFDEVVGNYIPLSTYRLGADGSIVSVTAASDESPVSPAEAPVEGDTATVPPASDNGAYTPAAEPEGPVGNVQDNS